MSNKLQFIRRYTKRETSKRSFQIVKTWATPKESESDQISGPSAAEGRLSHVSDVQNVETELTTEANSSDSSDLTYHPTENTNPEPTSGETTLPASTTETQTAAETTETPYTSQSPVNDNYEATDTSYIPRQEDDASPSAPHSSENPSESNSSVGSQKDSNRSEREQAAAASAFNTSRHQGARNDSATNKWTVKNWVDVDVAEEIQKLSLAMHSEETPEPMSSSSETKGNEHSGKSSPSSEVSQGPPSSVCEQEPEPLRTESVTDGLMPTFEPLTEPEITDPELTESEAKESPSKSSVTSSSSLTPRTLSVRLERIQVEKYKLCGSSSVQKHVGDTCSVNTRESHTDMRDARNDEMETSQPGVDDEITSSVHSNGNHRNISEGVKLKQRKKKIQKGPGEISDADCSEVASGSSTSSVASKQIHTESPKESDVPSRSSISPPTLQSYSEKDSCAGSKRRLNKKDMDTSSPEEADRSVSKDVPPAKKNKTQERSSPKSKSKKSMKQKSRKSPQTRAEISPQETKRKDLPGSRRRSPRDEELSVTPQDEQQPETEASSARKVQKSDTPSNMSQPKEPPKKFKTPRNTKSPSELSKVSGESESDREEKSDKMSNQNSTTKDPSSAEENTVKAKSVTKKQSRKTSRKSRTPPDLSSANEHEEETAVQTEKSDEQPTEKQTVVPEPSDENNDDAMSVASSLRLEVVVDFEGNQDKKMTGLRASSWKGKKISALKKPGGRSSRRMDQTSSLGSDDTLGFVTSTPSTKKKVTKRAPVRENKSVRKEKTVKPTGGGGKGRKAVTSDDEGNHGLSVSVWTGSSQPRRGSDVLDLDIVLECLQGVEHDMYEEAESRPCEKATQRVSTFVRKEVHKTICQVQEIKHRQSEAKKIRSKVKTLRSDLLEKQHKKMRLNACLKKLQSASGIDEDLINLNSWLDDYDKLIQAWDKSKAAQTKPQKYKWIGEATEEIKAIC